MWTSHTFNLSRPKTVCARFVMNFCTNSAMSCPYGSHNKDDAALCLAWTRGLCDKNLCMGRHFYLERDAVPARRIPLQQVTQASSNSAFSSPLVVKVKTLTETHRRVEVDLETGNRRSWIETENKELIDITGEDTPKKASLSVQVEEEEMKEGNKSAERKKENHCVQCGKEFKGERGVLSHQRHPKSKCHVV